MTAKVEASSAKKIAVGSVQAIHAMFSMSYLPPRNRPERRPLSTKLGSTRVGHPKLSKSDKSDFDRERAGVRGYGLSMGRNPSPGFVVSRQIRPLPMGEAKKNPAISCNRTFIGLHPAEREAARDVIADKPDHQRAGNDGQNTGRGQQAPIHSGRGKRTDRKSTRL